jgi:hypothetical protein
MAQRDYELPAEILDAADDSHGRVHAVLMYAAARNHAFSWLDVR